MPLLKGQIYTVDDIYNLPDGARAELINGELYMMAPPSRAHQRILSWLNTTIFNYIRAHGGECEVYPAPFAVFLNNSNDEYFEPDISVICDKDKLDNKGCHGAPDWIIEIVSPSSKRMDYYTKLPLYQAAGVREYWIVDPMRKMVIVYDMEHDSGPTIFTFTDNIKVNIYDDLCIDFQEITQAIHY